MENQEVNQGQVEETSSFSFVSDEEAAQGLSEEPTQEAPSVEEQPVQQDAPVESEASDFDAVLGGDITEQQGQTETQVEDQYSPEEIEAAVQMYLSDRLGREISSFEDLQGGGGYEDERIQAIADFVSETGRDPSDWFAYQSLNPDQMDDTTAIQVQMATDYPNLSHQEIETLMTNKYKVDENLYTEEEVRLSKLQMKIDAENARKVVSQYREKYAAPESQSGLSEEEMAMEKQAIDDWTNQSFKVLTICGESNLTSATGIASSLGCQINTSPTSADAARTSTIILISTFLKMVRLITTRLMFTDPLLITSTTSFSQSTSKVLQMGREDL